MQRMVNQFTNSARVDNNNNNNNNNNNYNNYNNNNINNNNNNNNNDCISSISTKVALRLEMIQENRCTNKNKKTKYFITKTFLKTT